jgi:high-affinity nickel permease
MSQRKLRIEILNISIFQDFRNMFNVKQMRVDAIYKALGNRHSVDAKTIARIVSKESKLYKNEKEADNTP